MKKFIKFLFLVFIICTIILVGAYFYLCTAVSKDSKTINIYIEQGNTYSSIASKLKENGLIRSEIVYKVYLKLNQPKETLEYGDYVLKNSYDLKELISVLEKGSVSLANTVSVTFYEGKNMRSVIKTICDKFNYKEEDIINKLINDYWFLDDSIKNKEIYYSLEGYLFPDTYEFYESADIDDIFRKLLNNFEKKVEPYKEEVQNSKYSFHEILTLASIIEQEAGSSNDRKGVSGVFYNRIKAGWSLGSDVTTYYAAKIDGFSRDLKKSELNECNAYNTRAQCMAGKLPVGPICNPSLSSIIAAIEPEEHDYYYFVADKNGKTYFNKTNDGHTKTVNKLIRDGLWIEFN